MGAKVRQIKTAFCGIIILSQSDLAEDTTIDVGHSSTVIVLPDGLKPETVKALIENVTAAHANMVQSKQPK